MRYNTNKGNEMEEYDQLKEEVKRCHYVIKKVAKEDKILDDIFAGMQIMNSPIPNEIKDLKILILGYNPGWGYF